MEGVPLNSGLESTMGNHSKTLGMRMCHEAVTVYIIQKGAPKALNTVVICSHHVIWREDPAILVAQQRECPLQSSIRPGAHEGRPMHQGLSAIHTAHPMADLLSRQGGAQSAVAT